MLVKISDIAYAQGGLVLRRKEQKKPCPNVYRSKRLTLRSLGDDGFIDSENLEDFYSSKALDTALYTASGDVIVRLSSPLCPVLVDYSSEGLLVPSQIAVLKIKDSNVVLPAYLRLCLAQRDIQEKVLKIESGTAQRTVKIGTIMDLQIVIPDMETQKKAVNIDILSRNRERMYRELIRQEQLLTESTIGKIIGGTIK